MASTSKKKKKKSTTENLFPLFFFFPTPLSYNLSHIFSRDNSLIYCEYYEFQKMISLCCLVTNPAPCVSCDRAQDEGVLT